MAIRFVSIEPAADTSGPAEPPGSTEAPDPAAPPETGEAAPPAEPCPGPKPRSRAGTKRREAAPAADDASAVPPAAGGPAEPGALPGFEDRPKPRRRAARPYWGFG